MKWAYKICDWELSVIIVSNVNLAFENTCSQLHENRIKNTNDSVILYEIMNNNIFDFIERVVI